jgi:hypothetical protein
VEWNDVVQAEENFTMLINTLTAQRENYRKAEFKKQQGITDDDDEEEQEQARKRKAEEEKKRAAAEKFKRENEERAAARKAAEEKKKKEMAEGKVPPAEEKKEEKKEGEDDDDDEGSGEKPIGNGGVTDKYTWTQTLQELTVVITHEQLGLAKGAVKSKALDIDIKKKTMKVGVKGQEPLISGDMHQAVKLENTMWTIGAFPFPLHHLSLLPSLAVKRKLDHRCLSPCILLHHHTFLPSPAVKILP